jgi:hypothetical protein
MWVGGWVDRGIQLQVCGTGGAWIVVVWMGGGVWVDGGPCGLVGGHVAGLVDRAVKIEVGPCHASVGG